MPDDKKLKQELEDVKVHLSEVRPRKIIERPMPVDGVTGESRLNVHGSWSKSPEERSQDSFQITWKTGIVDGVNIEYWTRSNEMIMFRYIDLKVDRYPIIGTGAVDEGGNVQTLGKLLAEANLTTGACHDFCGDIHVPCHGRSIDYPNYDDNLYLDLNKPMDKEYFRLDRVVLYQGKLVVRIVLTDENIAPPTALQKWRKFQMACFKMTSFILDVYGIINVSGDVELTFPPSTPTESKASVLEFVKKRFIEKGHLNDPSTSAQL